MEIILICVLFLLAIVSQFLYQSKIDKLEDEIYELKLYILRNVRPTENTSRIPD